MATFDAPLNVPNVTLAVARGNSGNAPGILSISGSGFGVAPNVILYRTMREATFDPAVVPAGEVGVMAGSNQHAQFNGRGVWAGHDPVTGGKSSVEFVNNADFRKFRHFVNIAVPDGNRIPGNATAERTFSTQSRWKPVWVSLRGGTNTSGLPDICLPTAQAGGDFNAGGNSCTHDFFRWTQGGRWAWNEFNGFGYVFDADDADPDGAPATQSLTMTSPAVDFPGTFIDSKSIAGYNSNVDIFTLENSYFDGVKYGAYALSSDGYAQAYYADIYLAAESSQGSNDWKQAVAIGNAATIADCTRLQMKKADSWTDTQIDVPIDDYEAATYTHYFVFSPADGVTVIKSGSIG